MIESLLEKLKQRMNCICPSETERETFDSGLEALVYASILTVILGLLNITICAVHITTHNIIINAIFSN